MRTQTRDLFKIRLFRDKAVFVLFIVAFSLWLLVYNKALIYWILVESVCFVISQPSMFNSASPREFDC